MRLQTRHHAGPARLGAVILLALVPLWAPRAPASQTPSCADRPEFTWLDFWVGEWRVLTGGQQIGTNRIRKILDGCAVTEEWTDARGGAGFSLFYVSPDAGGWRQVWVTNTALGPGGVKEKRLAARLRDGGVRFEGRIRSGEHVVLDRTTLRPLEDGRVRQTIERSSDGGTSWTTGFEAIYVRVAAGSRG